MLEPKIFIKPNLDFVIIGKTTNTKNLILKFQDQEVAKIPISALSSNAPQYQRKFLEKKLPSKNKKFKDFKKIKLEKALLQILSSPNYSNKSWVTEQFDQMVMCDTVKKSGSDSLTKKPLILC